MWPGLVIVCERNGHWAARLRQTLALPSGRLRETRTPAHCLEALAAAPASLVLVELPAGREEAALELISRVEREFPPARSVVLAERGLERLETAARELGAIHFAVAPRDLRPLAELARRMFQRSTPPTASLEDEIYSELGLSEES
jgi:hypothetical protein